MPRAGESAGRRAGAHPPPALPPPPRVTRLAVPTAPFGMVDRPRLRSRLDEGLAQPVTLVCAPAGSGKTALVADGVRGGDAVAWVSLEPSDDDAGRLWEAVLASLALAGAVPPGSA